MSPAKTFDPPGAVPASRRNGAVPDHWSPTPGPLTSTVRPLGAAGNWQVAPTPTTTSAEALLLPKTLPARTRTK